MFLLVSVRHVGAHPGEHQHGVSMQISIILGKTFLRISRIRNIPLTWILERVFVYVPPFISHGFWTLSIERFWFLFWSILNGVTLKTSNRVLFSRKLISWLKIFGHFPFNSQNSGNFGWYMKWNGPFRFGPTGIFGTSFEGGPLWPVWSFRLVELPICLNCCPLRLSALLFPASKNN